MQLSPTATAASPTRPILRDVIERPWARDTKVGDSTLGVVAGRALQFQLAGDGPSSSRELVPQSDAAVRLLEGPKGAAIEQALRGILATTDGYESRSSIAGISLSRGVRDFAVNSALNYMERGDVKGWNPAGGVKATGALKEALDGGRQVAGLAVAQAPDWINLGPFATRQLLRLAGSESKTPGDAMLGTWLTELAAHEPHHTITPPRPADIIKSKYLQSPLPPELEREQATSPFESLKPLNWLEEGTADVLSSWAGVLPAAASRLGVPHLDELPDPAFPEDFSLIMAVQSAASRGNRFTPDERVLVDKHIDATYGTPARSDLERIQMISMPLTGLRNYPTHVSALHEVLHMGGIDATDPKQVDRATELLQGARITHVPGRLADAIIEQQHLKPEVREQLRVAIRDLGEHLNGVPDEDAVDEGLDLIAKLAGVERTS
jgi:hypothetical protein